MGLEDMFKDIQRSKELMVDFRKKYSDFQCELNVSVCTTGAWPTSSIQPVKKAPDIVTVSERFTQFYLNRFSGRRLNFQMDKGKADVSVQFSSKCKKILLFRLIRCLCCCCLIIRIRGHLRRCWKRRVFHAKICRLLH